jgi:o-succinylbenzoate synthase
VIVRDLQISAQSLRLRRPLATARGTWDHRPGWVVSLFDGERRGHGEATPLALEPEAAERAGAVLERAGSALVGCEVPDSTQGIEAVLEALPGLSREPSARHALECALLDLLAQARQLPVCSLLSVTARPRVEVNALLSSAAPEALAEEGRQAAEAGFRVFKVKVGVADLPADDARLESLRAAVGSKARIRIDANGAWSASTARANLKTLCRHGLELCEQPVPAGETESLRRLRGTVECAIAADEAIADAERALALCEGGADLLVLRPMVLGGLLPSLRIAREASRHGVGSFVVSSLDGVVARAACGHLSAALPASDWASGLGVGPLFADLDEGAWAPVRGEIRIPQVAGLGIEGRPS